MPRYLRLLSPLLLVVTGCSTTPTCNLDDDVKARAGAGAVDCGHVAVGADRSGADACVVTAFQAGRAFFVVYDEQGFDSLVASAITRTADGTVTFLSWDSDPSGGSKARPEITAETCDGPSVADAVSARQLGKPLTCATSVSLARVCQ